MASITRRQQGTTGGRARERTLTLQELEDLCDDPRRDQPGGENVTALLTFDDERGFFLSARDGQDVYRVVDQVGEPVRFRTVEAALAALQDVPGLGPVIGLMQAGSRRRRHH